MYTPFFYGTKSVAFSNLKKETVAFQIWSAQHTKFGRQSKSENLVRKKLKGGRRKFLISLTFFFNLGILFFRKKSSMPLVCPKNKQLEGGNGCFLFSFVCWIRWYVFFKKSTHIKSVALKSIWKIENLREKVISHPYNMSNLDKFSSVTTMIVVVTHDITSMGFE